MAARLHKVGCWEGKASQEGVALEGIVLCPGEWIKIQEGELRAEVRAHTTVVGGA